MRPAIVVAALGAQPSLACVIREDSARFEGYETAVPELEEQTIPGGEWIKDMDAAEEAVGTDMEAHHVTPLDTPVSPLHKRYKAPIIVSREYPGFTQDCRAKEKVREFTGTRWEHHLKAGIDYLRERGGHPYLKNGTCEEVSCAWDTAIG